MIEASADLTPDLPFRINPYYARRLAETESTALCRMALPSPDEQRVLSYETSDPLAEEGFQALNRCVHRYRDRMLLLVTDACALYCRYCFRRRFTGAGEGEISDEDLDAAVGYLKSHSEVHELILSGGDPLMLSDRRLKDLLSRFRRVRPDLVIRLSTRMPAVLPARISSDLVSILTASSTVWVVLHLNHPDELSEETLDAIDRLAAAGLPLLSQTVLLRGVNDSPAVLQRLFYRLIERRVRPYYLFQGDLALGTSHFRVNLRRGLNLYAALQRRVSGLALPVYAVDLPQGGGKIRLHSESIRGEVDGYYILHDARGREYRYPVEWKEEELWEDRE